MVILSNKTITSDAHKSRICTQEERKNHLRQQCEKLPQLIKNRKPKLERLLVDHEHKLIYCVIPKVACTTWKGLLANKTSTGYNDHGLMKHWRYPKLVFSAGYLHRAGLDYIRNNYTSLWKSTYVHYKKFIIVRDPLQRVLSAYYDKLRDSTPLKALVRLMKTYFNNTGDVPLTDFIHYLVTPGYFKQRDIHWQTYESLCYPCHIRYDYILRLETMEHDQHFILPLIGIGKSEISLPKLNLSPLSTNSKLNESDYFSVDSDSMGKLIQKYKIDSDLFGYQFTREIGKSKCAIETKDGQLCC